MINLQVYPTTTTISDVAELARIVITVLVSFIVVAAIISALYAAFLMSSGKYDQGKKIFKWAIISIIATISVGLVFGFIIEALGAQNLI
jgi:hypothetical protein